MTVKVLAKLPEPDTDNNGLGPHTARIVANPKETILVVAVMRCETIEVKPQTGAQIPVMQFTAIELLDGTDQDLAMSLLQEARERRTGQLEIRHHEDLAMERRTELLFDGQDGRLGSTELTRTGEGDRRYTDPPLGGDDAPHQG